MPLSVAVYLSDSATATAAVIGQSQRQCSARGQLSLRESDILDSFTPTIHQHHTSLASSSLHIARHAFLLGFCSYLLIWESESEPDSMRQDET